MVCHPSWAPLVYDTVCALTGQRTLMGVSSWPSRAGRERRYLVLEFHDSFQATLSRRSIRQTGDHDAVNQISVEEHDAVLIYCS